MFNIFGNSTTNDTVSWQPEPTTRGTWGILSSCLITISLCIWSAVHLNVPGPEEPFWQTLRKIKWLAIGLVAPELVLFTAWYQYVRAKEMTETVSSALCNRKPGNGKGTSHLDAENQQPTEVGSTIEVKGGKDEIAKTDGQMQDLERGEVLSDKWSMTQGFFLDMGGLAFDTRAARGEGQYLPANCPPQLILQPDGIKHLLEHHPKVFENIDVSQIGDKSKVGDFGKTIACLQTLWFLAQCLSRLIQGLPISLLELNTSAHCICALIIYILWWHKPLDVERPVLIPAESYRETLAFMWMRSFPPEGWSGKVETDYITTVGHRVNHPTERPVSSSMSPQANLETCGAQGKENAVKEAEKPEQHPAPNELKLEDEEEFLGTGLFYKAADSRAKPLRLSQIGIQRWELAAQLCKGINQIQPPRLLTYRQRNWKLPKGLSITNTWIAWTILILSSVIYGGIHAVAWNAPFRTHPEQLLWRISVPVIMGYGILLVAFNSFLDMDGGYHLDGKNLQTFIIVLHWIASEKNREVNDSEMKIAKALHLLPRDCNRTVYRHGENPDMKETLSKFSLYFIVRPILALCILFSLLFFVLVFIASLAYPVARAYLVVECFLSLFHSPAALYRQPDWASYFPHIG